jgi:hypothetical protein
MIWSKIGVTKEKSKMKFIKLILSMLFVFCILEAIGMFFLWASATPIRPGTGFGLIQFAVILGQFYFNIPLFTKYLENK